MADRATRGPLAQLVEQGTLNPKVEGSSPSRPIKSPHIRVFSTLVQQRPGGRVYRMYYLASCVPSSGPRLVSTSVKRRTGGP
jgi:hypothetical protein